MKVIQTATEVFQSSVFTADNIGKTGFALQKILDEKTKLHATRIIEVIASVINHTGTAITANHSNVILAYFDGVAAVGDIADPKTCYGFDSVDGFTRDVMTRNSQRYEPLILRAEHFHVSNQIVGLTGTSHQLQFVYQVTYERLLLTTTEGTELFL